MYSKNVEIIKARLINTEEARNEDRKYRHKFPVDTDYNRGYTLF